MTTLQEANSYMSARLFSDAWDSADNTKRQKALTTAANMLKSHFVLRDNIEDSESFKQATCEQALHLLSFAAERLQLQLEGVGRYRVDDIEIYMSDALISPVAKSLLNKIRVKVGNIV